MTRNIILIGMPGSGKSTIGVQLAKQMGLDFIDTDLLIQKNQGQKLQTILDHQGYQALRAIEAQQLMQLQMNNVLVATGGSAVYSDDAMQSLKHQGTIVYLAVSFTEIENRIDNEGKRGIARPPEQSLEDVYAERLPLYKRYADITIDNNQAVSIDDIEQKLIKNSFNKR
jgi:shikimate kinase